MIQKIINIEIQRVKKIAWAISFLWLLIIFSSLMWNLYIINTHTKEIAKSEARANFNKDQAIRLWATEHGGVYVPMNKRTPANPSLSHIPERNIIKPSGDTLTLMNPAYMIRQMFDEFPLEYGAVGRIVSLKPLNPNNAPDEWEKKALLSFEKGEKECFEFTEINGEEYLRLIQPMITKEGCLKCHAFQGYKVGDIRGGVGVSIKMAPLLQASIKERNTLFFFYLLILCVGFIGIWGGYKRYIQKTKEKLEADELLIKSEEKVNTLFLEINKRKKAEERLKESEEKFRLLFVEMAGGVYLHEIIYNKKGEAVDYRILETNPASEKQLNIKPEDANGKLATELYGTEEPPYLDIYAKVAETGIPFQFEEYFQPLKKHFHISVYSPKKGKFATIFLDITERKLAEKILKETYEKNKTQNTKLKIAKEKAEESEAKYRKMVEHMNSGVAIYEAINDGKDFKFIDFNKAAEKITNTTISDVAGSTLLSKFPNMDKSPLFKALQTVYKSGKDLYLPPFFYKDKQREGWRENYIYKLPTGEIVAIFQDTTERENADKISQNHNKELNLAKEKAEESDRLKSAFLANMSHEIRTPMNGILGFAELLKEPELTGDEQQEYIRIIEKSGVRMLNIINDIIDISKIESGLMTLDTKESNINEQVEYIYNFFKPEVEAKGIQFSYKNTLPAKEAIIKIDREKCFAILTNLVKNAIKYTNEGFIEFGYKLVEAQNSASLLQFYVKDTGIGIPTDRQDAIFERFIQADIFDKMAHQGAGLGLAITKAYVELLGGKIGVESQEGKGSTFYFTIPYNSLFKQEITSKNVSTTNLEPLKRNLKILIVEDDETSKMLLEIMVKVFGKEIIKASTGLEAIEAFRNNPDIDLIMMDIQMPGMNGLEATHQIRKFNNDVIIIAQTAFGLSGDKENALKAGCNDYISKPINKTKLFALIRKYFNKQMQ